MPLKWVVISGCSRGLGYSLVDSFIRAEWQVFGIFRGKNDGDRLQARFGDSFFGIQGDVRNPETAQKLQAAIHSQANGTIDALINNAGQGGKGLRLEHLDLNTVNELWETHCLGAMRITQAALAALKNSASATVVNISSRHGSITKVAKGEFAAADVTYAYRIAKASQNMFTASLHQELLPLGIRVFAVHPGQLKTEMSHGSGERETDDAAESIFDLVLGHESITPGSFLSLDEGYLAW